MHAVKEICWLRTLLEEIGFRDNSPTLLKCNNQSAIALCKDNKFHAHTKHMDIRYHYIHQAVERKQIKVEYISGTNNPADIMMKALTRKPHDKMVNKLHLEDIET